MAAASVLQRTTIWRMLAVFAAILAIAALGRLLLPERAPTRPAPNRAPTAAAPLNYDAAVARATTQVDAARQIADAAAGQWLPQERLAITLVTRARLTGDFDDYAAAQAALDRAFATAVTGSGPHLTQASLDMSLHRLAHAETMLAAIGRYAVPPDAGDAEQVEALRGDIALYRGRYDDAVRHYGTDAFRHGVLEGMTGKPDAALASFDAVERSLRLPTAQTLANLALQRGGVELRRGDWPAAARHFTRAEALFPGWWLAEAHSAQMLALSGKRAEAIAKLTPVTERSGAPELMDALAALHRDAGDAANAKLWADRAAAIWARRVQQIPEAAWGHAVEHELTFGDPARALDLAQRDDNARPYGASALMLANAWLANNRPAEALKVLKPVLASDYVSADVHVSAAQAHELLGESQAAADERKAALKINPRAFDPAATLIWFGH